MRGIFRLSTFRDVAVVSGAGVGGGSLGYANTLYRAPRRFYEDGQWAELADWEAALAPHYDEAERMLGVDRGRRPTTPPTSSCASTGARSAPTARYAKTRVGVYFGEPGVTVPDPYFGGAGPERAGCIACGRCMVGCPHNAKNTLRKNYLWLAERAGAEILPEREVVDVADRRARRLRGLRGHHGAAGRVAARAAGGRSRARGVVIAAGALGTNKLLSAASSPARCRASRTGSGAACARTPRRSWPSRCRRTHNELIKRVAITSASTPTPTRTSRRSRTATRATR